ncbi:MAG: hypothetical protein E7812_12760 [Phenylobacterium sp.]|nr:MAG: hypothetical protein E7812_12760 [Phenylobacterium sp.]
MFRTLVVTAAVAMIAGSASAQDIRVNIAGKDDAVIQQDIRVAAHRVCGAYANGVRGLEPTTRCYKYVVRDAEGQLVQARALAQAAKLQLASK